MADNIAGAYTTIPLVKSIRYESYQFHAFSEPAGGITVEQLFIKEILYILGWVKNRCRETDLPQEMKDIPNPEDFRSYKIEDIRSFRYDIGYKLEVHFLEDKKTWAIQITEPDRGPCPENPEKNRAVVPGRLFVTDIGLKIINEKTVEIGSRTYVDEPYGTITECDAFRQAFIKKFLKDSNIKLREDWPIKETPFLIKNQDHLDTLSKWLVSENRQSLAVIFTGMKNPIVEADTDKTKDVNSIDEKAEIQKQNPENYLKEFNDLAKHLCAYAFFFQIPEERRNAFLSKMKLTVQNEDLFLIEANKYKNDLDKAEDLIFSISDYLSNGDTRNKVDRKIKKCFEKRHADFGKVQFVPDIREHSFGDFMNVKRSKEEIVSRHEIILNDLKKEHEGELQKKDEEIEHLRNKIDTKEFNCKEIEDKYIELKKLSDNDKEEHKNIVAKLEECLARERAKAKRPKEFSAFCEWVNENFNDCLILCERAQNEISKIYKEYDIDDICDSIEYLAKDYYEQLTGSISEDERKNRCSEKYNKYIDITALTIPKMSNKKDYEFKYTKRNGSPTKAKIDQHIYLNGSEGRIYFHFDKEDKRIIIASLPKHLPY
ncbi:MAG: hypothetical protein WCY62_06690 [Clostridia bacterium]